MTVFYSWVCLGLMFANLARTQEVPNASTLSIFAGQYIEAVVSFIFLQIFEFNILTHLYDQSPM